MSRIDLPQGTLELLILRTRSSPSDGMGWVYCTKQVKVSGPEPYEVDCARRYDRTMVST
jgi:hypothetical protein